MKKTKTKQGQSASDALSFGHKQSEKIDAFIRLRSAQDPELRKLLIVALGGYGRRQLSPASDVDLLIFSESPWSRQAQAAVTALTTWPWPQGQHLSLMTHDAASLAALMEKDVAFVTSLMDRRVICGPTPEAQLLDHCVGTALAQRGTVNLIAAKLAEQDARHRAQGDNRYVLQPNVKEGKGALRDLHSLRWLAQITLGNASTANLLKARILNKEEAAALDRAERFFTEVRYHLHSIAKRAQDRLNFELQPIVATAMGYKQKDPTLRAEIFMRDYFRMAQETGHLTRIICAALEDRALAAGGATAGRRKPAVRETLDGFPLRGNRLDLPPDATLKSAPEKVIGLFRVAQAHDTDIHPEAYRRLRRILPRMKNPLRDSKAAYAAFLDILCDGRRTAQTLRRMNEAGVLTALFEDFSNIQTHMQYDMYHTYTADEHTIRACDILHDIASGRLQETAPLATTLFPTLSMPRILFLAMFLHDMAKGSGDDHSTAGAAIARKLAPRFAISPTETEMLAWLIENHLLMTATAFKRDLEDHKTIDDFIAGVQSPERLKMLEILTVADIMAVGPDVWNNWKAGLLRQLYQRAYARLTGTEIAGNASQSADLGIDPQAPFPQIILHHDEAGDFTRLTVAAPDTKGLFSTIAGAIAAAGANIVQARIHTLPDGTAVDIFDLQDMRGHAYENEKFLVKTLRAALNGKLNVSDELAARHRQQPRQRQARAQTHVIIDNTASYMHTLVEIQTADRPGLLHDITACLSQEGLNIHAAKVATFGRQAADVFYVKDAFGLKILHPDRLASLEKALMMGLAKPLSFDL